MPNSNTNTVVCDPAQVVNVSSDYIKWETLRSYIYIYNYNQCIAKYMYTHTNIMHLPNDYSPFQLSIQSTWNYMGMESGLFGVGYVGMCWGIV